MEFRSPGKSLQELIPLYFLERLKNISPQLSIIGHGRQSGPCSDLPYPPEGHLLALRSLLSADEALIDTFAGEALRTPVRSFEDAHDRQEDKPLCARVNGFSLHAARTVRYYDNAGLEQLCRYGLRAPFSIERLSIDMDGRVCNRLHRPWLTPEVKLEIMLDPLAFLSRVVALLPAPYLNLVRYHSVFANRSRFRNLLRPTSVHDTQNHQEERPAKPQSESLDSDLARSIPRNVKLPEWAWFRGKAEKGCSWNEWGHRPLFPLYDATCIKQGFHARLVVNRDIEKAVSPYGYTIGGLVLADRNPLHILRTGTTPNDKLKQIAIAEGEPDFLSIATNAQVERPIATMEITRNASWVKTIGDRIPGAMK